MGWTFSCRSDECHPRRDRDEVEEAMRRTLDWARRLGSVFAPRTPALGIVQGGLHPELRRCMPARLAELDFAGYAVGGLECRRGAWRDPGGGGCGGGGAPQGRPRYLMGVGLPEDLLRFVQWDTIFSTAFCRPATGRNGMLFTSRGRMNIRLARYARDPLLPTRMWLFRVLDLLRGYLRHLAAAGRCWAHSLRRRTISTSTCLWRGAPSVRGGVTTESGLDRDRANGRRRVRMIDIAWPRRVGRVGREGC